ncbi:hypothetical protein [Antrihabitans cavernicola]|uniref:Ig-like domain-containing protein n=1 Tax=Antrihabitans cavernicola TaxID=2495913 RepID=A0A5A7SHL5_9NOCA|nr:hypothetical protein [Spelaeibacter cavernicola]KAA0024103.1 hypothetical protein FOY51_05985 [Spelaeibacter cavernicola]
MKYTLIAAAATTALAAAVFAGPAQAHPGGPQFDYDHFQSPSGNISCQIFDGSQVRCDIVDYTFTPPQEPDGGCGASGFGHSVVLDADGARFICAGDTVADPTAPVLDYDETTGVGGVECYSTSDYLFCSAGDHSFQLARDWYSFL